MILTLPARRWRILALLFVIRTIMAIQFQMVAALSPMIEQTFAVGLADVGLLIGLYFAPGILMAVPGGAVGRHFGDKRVVRKTTHGHVVWGPQTDRRIRANAKRVHGSRHQHDIRRDLGCL